VRLRRSKQAHTQLGQIITGLTIQACPSKPGHHNQSSEQVITAGTQKLLFECCYSKAGRSPIA
jgi:hypothetical protein